jgi:hypothetical protein
MVEKVLQGDVEEVRDTYVKLDIPKKAKQAVEQVAETFCQRLGGYRQQFCWGGMQVFDDNGVLLLKENEIISNLWGATVLNTSHLVEMILESKVTMETEIFLRI